MIYYQDEYEHCIINSHETDVFYDKYSIIEKNTSEINTYIDYEKECIMVRFSFIYYSKLV